MKTCKSVGCCKRLNNWFLQPCSHVGGAGTWLCFCTPLRTAWFPSKFRQQFTIPVCVWCIQIFQSGFQSLNIHMTLMQRVIIPTLLLGAGIFFFPLFFLVESEQRAYLENSPAKLQHWKEKVWVRACLLSHSICLHPSKQQAKMCQHKHTCTENSSCCFGHLRELGSLASSLTRPQGTGGVFLF